MHFAVRNGQGAGNRFNRTACTEKVTGHGFCRADVHILGMVTEYAGHRHRLVKIVQVRRCAVSIDIINIFHVKMSIVNSEFHTLGLLQAFRSRRRNMICVGIAAVTCQFAINTGAAFFSMFQFLKNNDPRAFAHDKPVTVFIKRPGCMCGIIISRGKRFHGAEPRYRSGRNSRFRTAGNGRIQFAALNHTERVTDGIRACRTSRNNAGAMPLEPEGNGHLT